MSPLILAGPTASGKTEIALELAALMRAEVVAADSMQVYRSLDILSAKPSMAERARVPHHCIDIADITEEFTVARWLAAANAAVASIQARGLTPLVVGGTGLYIRALRFGLDPNPPTPPELRDALSARQLPDLIAELRQIDPATADVIDLKNRRRVERALAIALQGARPNRSSWQAIPRPSTLVVICRDTEDLSARIRSRIDAMFAAGVVDEARRLIAAGLRPGLQASQALGLRQIEDLLAGRYDELETRRRLTTATRQFAKRQLTWFRRETGAHWLNVPPGEGAQRAARRIIELAAINR